MSFVGRKYVLPSDPQVLCTEIERMLFETITKEKLNDLIALHHALRAKKKIEIEDWLVVLRHMTAPEFIHRFAMELD